MMKRRLNFFVLFFLCLISFSLWGQSNSIDRQFAFDSHYQKDWRDKSINGPKTVSFSGKARIYTHGGFLMIGYKLSQTGSISDYDYGGKTYNYVQFPAINKIKVTSVTGRLVVVSSCLPVKDRIKENVTIYIGGPLDNSGSLGGNNMILSEKDYQNFTNCNNNVRFEIKSINYDYDDVHAAINARLTTEKNKTKKDSGEQLKDRVDQPEAGLTDKGDKKDNNESITNKRDQKKKAEEIESEASREAKRKMYEASLYSSEGERLYKMGVTFWPAALEQYKKAQTIWRTDQVQERINSIAAVSELSKSVDKLGENIDNKVSIIDPLGKTKHLFWFINYGGLKPNFKKIEGIDDQNVRDVSFGINGSRLFINYECRLIYQSTPKVAYTTNLPNENVWVSSEKLGLGLSGGLSVPMFNNALCLYGNYGFNMGLDVKTTVPDGYEILEEHSDVTNDYTTWKPSTPVAIGRITGGIYIRIPKTKVGINLSYVNSWFKTSKSEDNFGKIKRLSDDKIIEYRTPVQDRIKYSYFSAGIAFPIN
ncbi:hypothetical protein [Sphingobacterium siyangense]|uniref:hypothetical protein n=1 Tax=Sphingobacterium siyangense TaxID=459529 RepID=UPI002FDB636B